MGAPFTVFVIEGDFRNFNEPEVGFLRFDGLTWDTVSSLCLLAIRQGYHCVVLKGKAADIREE